MMINNWIIDELKRRVYEANMLLPRYGLITFTWGNASEIDRNSGLVAIKPSGVDYDKMKPNDIVIVDLDGRLIDGMYNPSTDTPTHLEIYKAFPEVNGVVHTHSSYATSWAQAGKDIPCYGTTHADYFYGPIPCIRNLTAEEIEAGYERNTGVSIIERFKEDNINPLYVPGCVCKNHGPFTWGRNAYEAVHNAVVVEEVAKMAILTRQINPEAGETPQYMQDKHFMRKHGPNAYYGQRPL